MSTRRVPVRAPFRLDLTLALLQPFPTAAGNLQAESARAGAMFPVAVAAGNRSCILDVAQAEPGALVVRFPGHVADDDAQAFTTALSTMLALDVNLRQFDDACAAIPWLAAFARLTRGVKPARFASLWEAGVNAIVFQSVSMASAAAVLDRFVTAFGCRTMHGDETIVRFPAPTCVTLENDGALRATGLSRAKCAALRALAAAILAGAWDPARFAARSTAEICAELTGVAGIGPWSAAVIALRGLGRLDVFPLRDTGVERTIAALSGTNEAVVSDVLAALGDTRGMLYHLLLLARLRASRRATFLP